MKKPYNQKGEYMIDKKKILRQMDHLTRPPRLENRTKNVLKGKKTGKN